MTSPALTLQLGLGYIIIIRGDIWGKHIHIENRATNRDTGRADWNPTCVQKNSKRSGEQITLCACTWVVCEKEREVGGIWGEVPKHSSSCMLLHSDMSSRLILVDLVEDQNDRQRHTQLFKTLKALSESVKKVYNHDVPEDEKQSVYLPHFIDQNIIIWTEAPTKIGHRPQMTAVHQSGLWWKRLVVVRKRKKKPLHFKSTFDVSPLFFQATHASVVLWKTQTVRQY